MAPETSRCRRAPARVPLFVTLFFLVGAVSWAQDLASFERRTTVHVLENGWTFIILERPVAPVFSFSTFVDVGSAQEVPGITGLAHMFEHMAFKGTPVVGTTDYEAEKRALEAMEEAYQAYQRERLSPDSDPEKLERLYAEFKRLEEEADRFVVTNEFTEILEREGSSGINAFTSADETGYFYSLPANRLELFAYLESERFLNPVFREFYKEREVVQEERRQRTESQPLGRLVEQFVAAAFSAHPYKQPVVGYMSDLQSFTITDARSFFETYYAPSNKVTAIVGSVKAEEVIPLLERYFGRIPRRPHPPSLRTLEPSSIAEKTVTLREPGQPFYLEGYHKGSVTHPDQPVYDAIDDILSRGRTSRLYRTLVRDRRLAAAVQSFSSFPGSKYPNLWMVFAVPSRGVTNEEVRDAVREELEGLTREMVTEEELERFKTRARADLIRSLGSNQGLANQLVSYQLRFGDWRELFRYLERLERVTREDVLRVARETFRPANRTVGMIVTQESEEEQ